MALWDKIVGRSAKVSREAVVNTLNDLPTVCESLWEQERAMQLSRDFAQALHDARSRNVQSVEYAPNALDVIIKECPDFWEAYAARGYARKRRVMEQTGTFATIASMPHNLAEKNEELVRVRHLALRDLEKACRKLRLCDTTCSPQLFELSTYERALEELRDAWRCQSCGRWWTKDETKCPYTSCQR